MWPPDSIYKISQFDFAVVPFPHAVPATLFFNSKLFILFYASRNFNELSLFLFYFFVEFSLSFPSCVCSRFLKTGKVQPSAGIYMNTYMHHQVKIYTRKEKLVTNWYLVRAELVIDYICAVVPAKASNCLSLSYTFVGKCPKVVGCVYLLYSAAYCTGRFSLAWDFPPISLSSADGLELDEPERAGHSGRSSLSPPGMCQPNEINEG